jgi:hypothetical protein
MSRTALLAPYADQPGALLARSLAPARRRSPETNL